MDYDDDGAQMPAHVNSARAVQREMERRRRIREQNAQTQDVGGTIRPDRMPIAKDRFDEMIGKEGRKLTQFKEAHPEEFAARLASHFEHAYNAQLRQTLSAVSSVAPSIEQTSIRDLEKTFGALRDAELFVYAADEQSIGPRIGVTNVAEATLKALATYEKERRSRINDRKWHIIGGGLAALVTGIVAWILRGLLGA